MTELCSGEHVEGTVYYKKLLVPLYPFFPLFSSLLSLSSLSSPFPSRSHSLFLFFPLSLLRIFFFEGAACTVCLRDVRDDTVDCNFSESIVSSLK